MIIRLLQHLFWGAESFPPGKSTVKKMSRADNKSATAKANWLFAGSNPALRKRMEKADLKERYNYA